MLNEYEQKLLAGWEEVFYKAQLSMWILLALKDGPKHMAIIKDFSMRMTADQLAPDDKSMYRALRRLHKSDLILYTMEPGRSGPERKLYSLTPTGSTVLKAFLRRNISNVFYSPTVRQIIEKG